MNAMRLMSYVLISVLFMRGSGVSQIENPGFENWGTSAPVSWFTSNSPDYTNLSQSAMSHSGASAAQGEVINFFGFLIPPILQSGTDARGFPCTERPAAFSGYYQFFPQGGDEFGVNVVLYTGGVKGTPVAVAAAAFTSLTSSYTQFNVPFSYLTGDTPDTCVIQFIISGPTPGPTWHEGSMFLLDDIAYSGTVSVGDPVPGLPVATVLKQNYPNPFNPSTTISFDLAGSGHVRLSIFDVLGKEVATLTNEYLNPGEYSVKFDGSRLSSGVYYYRLRTSSAVQTRTLIIQK
jgi:hypothetical protein